MWFHVVFWLPNDTFVPKYFWKSFGRFKIPYALWTKLSYVVFRFQLGGISGGCLRASIWNMAGRDHDKHVDKWNVFSQTVALNHHHIQRCFSSFILSLQLWALAKSQPTFQVWASSTAHLSQTLSLPSMPLTLFVTLSVKLSCLLEVRKNQWIIKNLLTCQLPNDIFMFQ